MRIFLPEFEGGFTAAGIPHDFTSRLAERVRTGLFVPGNRRRADYQIDSLGKDRIAFRAASFWTAIALGLNEVVVERSSTAISYRVRYRTWTLYCVALGALLLAGLTVCSFSWARDEIHSYPYGTLLFWSQGIFWGLAWPWILTAMHKRFAARCLEGILREVLRGPAPA